MRRLARDPLMVSSCRSGRVPPALALMLTGRPSHISKRASICVSHKLASDGYDGRAQTNESGPRIRSQEHQMRNNFPRRTTLIPERSQSAPFCHSHGHAAHVTMISASKISPILPKTRGFVHTAGPCTNRLGKLTAAGALRSSKWATTALLAVTSTQSSFSRNRNLPASAAARA